MAMLSRSTSLASRLFHDETSTDRMLSMIQPLHQLCRSLKDMHYMPNCRLQPNHVHNHKLGSISIRSNLLLAIRFSTRLKVFRLWRVFRPTSSRAFVWSKAGFKHYKSCNELLPSVGGACRVGLRCRATCRTTLIQQLSRVHQSHHSKYE